MGRYHLRLFALAGAALLGAGTFLPARAQDPDDQQRGVARISLMNGEVSVRRGDSGEWVAGVINAPLLTDDRISTGPNSRAEIQFDASNILRLGGNAEIRLADLQSNRFQMELAKGTATYRVLRATGVNVEVDTPSVSVRPSKVGAYRIAVNENGETEAMSRAGEVEVFTPRGSQWISQGQMMVARGTSADPEFQIVGARPFDDWDRWNDERDRRFLQSPSAQYVDPASSGIDGTEELDNNGVWTETPNYGYVWRPNVGVDWAPYRAGRWVWEDWYGWTWVSADPWGWAPYHYGRWLYDGGWCWYPGGRGFRSYWSPALVAWFGWGGGVGFGFGFGNVGWVPLAPFEVFHPWWGRGFYGREGFARNINITNTNISNAYRNARIGNGVSGMAAGDFRAGRFNSVGRLSGEQVRSAGLVRGQMPLAPTSANLHYSAHPASFTPHTNENTHFFAHQQPSAAQRVPFSQQQRAMGAAPETPARPGAAPAASQNRPATANVVRPQTSSPTAAAPQAARPSQNGASSGGWRRFGEPAAAGNGATGQRNPAMENTHPSQAPSTGIQRFGVPSSNSGQRYNAPASNAPAPRNNAPTYSAPRSSAPPQQSAPRGGGGGGGNTRPSGGGGSSHSSGGSRGHR